MDTDIESIRKLCRQYKPEHDKTFGKNNSFRAIAVCGLVTASLGTYLSNYYANIQRAMINQKITNEVLILKECPTGFLSGHTFLVIKDTLVDGAFYQYMDFFNLAHEEPDDLLIIQYSKLEEKIEEMSSSLKGELIPKVKSKQHLNHLLRSLWDYKMPSSYLKDF
ncbi:MAG: hypothetical protein AABX39_04885 [Nanoarchaeota archaeon]